MILQKFGCRKTGDKNRKQDCPIWRGDSTMSSRRCPKQPENDRKRENYSHIFLRNSQLWNLYRDLFISNREEPSLKSISFLSCKQVKINPDKNPPTWKKNILSKNITPVKGKELDKWVSLEIATLFSMPLLFPKLSKWSETFIY